MPSIFYRGAKRLQEGFSPLSPPGYGPAHPERKCRFRK